MGSLACTKTICHAAESHVNELKQMLRWRAEVIAVLHDAGTALRPMIEDAEYGIAAAVIAVAWAQGMIAGLVSTGARTPVPVIERGAAFSCTPISVWDGDGPVQCAEGPKLRLAGIAAREIDGSCRPGQPCPDATGINARDALVRLLGGPRGTTRNGHVVVRGPKLTCISDGSARGSRTAAWCKLPDGRDLSCAMIETRTAVRWLRYDPKNRCSA